MQKVLATVVLVVVALALVALVWLRTGPALAEPAEGERPAPLDEPSSRDAAPITAPAPSQARAAQAAAPEPAAPTPEPAAAPALAASDRATLVVYVKEGARSALQGTVGVWNEKEEPLAKAPLSPTDGTARFEELAPSKVVLRVDDLEAELLPPRMQAKRDRKGVEVALEPGLNEATLEVERRAFVYGYVRDVDGNPWQAELLVRFGTPGPWERQVPPVDLRTKDGYYEGYLYPGKWFSEVSGLEDTDRGKSQRVASPRPPRAVHQLDPGSVTQIDFHAVAGECVLVGTILDHELEPFVDLTVLVEKYDRVSDPDSRKPLEVTRGVSGLRTDERGTFTLGGLTPGTYRVWCGMGSYSPMAHPDKHQIGEVPGKTIVEVPDTGRAELELRLRRYRPTHFHGTVVVDPAWARRNRAVDLDPLGRIVLPPSEIRPEERVIDLRLGRGGEFDFYLDLEGGSAYVEFSLKGETVKHPLLASVREPGPFVIEFP
jgi:hypothetical protein